DLYQVDPAQREHLTELARESKAQAWWQPYGLPYATYVGLEAEVTCLSDYGSGVFPWLLQTPDYARIIQEQTMPKLSPAVIEQRIEVRLARQAALTCEGSWPPQLDAIIDEAVLHRPVGSPKIMSDELGQVIGPVSSQMSQSGCSLCRWHTSRPGQYVHPLEFEA